MTASLLSLVFGVYACSSSSSNKSTPVDSGASSEAGGMDAGLEDADASAIGDVVTVDTAVIVDPMNCVPPGTKDNSLGIGGYCSPAAGQCAMQGLAGMVTICTADLAGAPTHGWFCTTPCTMSSQCGPGIACITTSAGEVCVPSACSSLFPEAGPPPVPDAGSVEAGLEAGPEPEAGLDGGG
jgi:hypothetical protein